MNIDDLTMLIRRTVQLPPACKVGVVAATSPLSVTFYGDQTSTTVSLRLSSYTPAEGDKVLLVPADGQWIVIGKVQ